MHAAASKNKTSYVFFTAQLMSEGTHAFAQARKIVETPFPHPHAHLISLSLLVFSLLTPLCCVAWTSELWVALVMDAASTFAFTAMNEVATDLEDPFVGPPNNLALVALHTHFNDDMLSYGREYAVAAGESGAAVGVLPPAAARAAAAAQRAQEGGGTSSNPKKVAGRFTYTA
jgi:predicted membrane chloride channel (bestrophin family)